MRTMVLLSLLCLFGCERSTTKEVVLYTSVDEPVARPIVAEFTKRTGIAVIIKTDAEASKTAGLAATLRAERANPRADVFWNNEPFHTINLAEEGVLAAYASPAAADVAARFKDDKNRWAGNALRQRVIVRGPGVTGIDTVPDLVTTQWHQKICMANPAFGTTSGHLAALFVLWGPERGETFLRALKANEVRLLGGNSEVVKQVALGQYAAGLTDNDDVDAAIREGQKVTAVPAKLRDGTGTLAVPCTVALVAGARHEPEAKRLIDYLLSAEVEAKLREAKFAVAGSTHGENAAAAVGMRVDYREVARMMPRAVEAARRILEGRE